MRARRNGKMRVGVIVVKARRDGGEDGGEVVQALRGVVWSYKKDFLHGGKICSERSCTPYYLGGVDF